MVTSDWPKLRGYYRALRALRTCATCAICDVWGRKRDHHKPKRPACPNCGHTRCPEATP